MNDVEQVDRDYGAIDDPFLDEALRADGMHQVADHIEELQRRLRTIVPARDAEIAALQARVAELEGFAADVYATTDNDSLNDRAKHLLGFDKEPTQ